VATYCGEFGLRPALIRWWSILSAREHDIDALASASELFTELGFLHDVAESNYLTADRLKRWRGFGRKRSPT